MNVAKSASQKLGMVHPCHKYSPRELLFHIYSSLIRSVWILLVYLRHSNHEVRLRKVWSVAGVECHTAAMCDQLNQSSNNELQPPACTKGFQLPACDNILTSLDSHHLPTPDLSEDDHLPQELLQDNPPPQEIIQNDSSTQDLLHKDALTQDLLQEDLPAQDLIQNDPQSQDLLQNDLPPQDLLQEDFLPMCVDSHPASGVPASGIFTDPCPSFPELPHLDSLVPLQCFKSTTVGVTTALEGGATLPVLPSQQEVCVPADMTYGSQGHHLTVVTPTPAAQVTHIRVRDKKKKCKSIYKHVPHREKPPHLVARRNARERRRVQSVNVAFARLRRVVPFTSGRSKRVSKVKTLQGAIDYIYQLQDLLEDTPPHTYNCSALHHNNEFTTTDQYNKPQHKTDNHVFRNCATIQANSDLSSRSAHVQQLRPQGTGYACRSSLSFISDHQDRQHWSNPEEGDEQQHLSECISQDILAGY